MTGLLPAPAPRAPCYHKRTCQSNHPARNSRWVSKIKYQATDTDNGKTLGQPSTETYDQIAFTYNVDGTLALHQVSSGSWGGALAGTAVTIADNTFYTIKIERHQQRISAVKTDESASIGYTFSADVSPGLVGFYADSANVKFDNFNLYQPARSTQQVPRFSGMADASISSGTLLVNDSTRGGFAQLDHFADNDYIVQVDVDLNGGSAAHVCFRAADMNNLYRVVLTSGRSVTLQKMVSGSPSTIGTGQSWTPSTASVKVKCSGTTRTVWRNELRRSRQPLSSCHSDPAHRPGVGTKPCLAVSSIAGPETVPALATH